MYTILAINQLIEVERSKIKKLQQILISKILISKFFIPTLFELKYIYILQV
jgi:hypothetical protein